MKINELIKVGEREEKQIIHHEAEKIFDTGEIIKPAWDEEVINIIPITKVVTRDMTDKEIVEIESQQLKMLEIKKTNEERIDVLESITDDVVLFIADMIGGI